MAEAKLHEKTQARKLRKEGYSVREISKLLSVSKASVSVWMRNIREPISQSRESILRSQAIAANANVRRSSEKREAAEARGFALAQECDDFRVLSALYWGEGTKQGRSFRLTNSDASMLALVVRVMSDLELPMTANVAAYEENGLSKDQVKDFWSQVLRFSPTVYWVKVSRASQLKGVGKIPYGTCCIRSTVEAGSLIRGGMRFLVQKITVA